MPAGHQSEIRNKAYFLHLQRRGFRDMICLSIVNKPQAKIVYKSYIVNSQIIHNERFFL